MKSRKIISLILALCVIISVLALSVFSAAAGYIAGQDEDANDIIIHDSNEIDGTRISDMDYDDPTAYTRIIDDYPGYQDYPDDYGNSGWMVSRIRKPSATPDEATSDDDAPEHQTSEKSADTGKEKSAADSSSKSPKTGYTSEVAVLIILMFFAVIGIGVSVCNLTKKRD